MPVRRMLDGEAGTPQPRVDSRLPVIDGDLAIGLTAEEAEELAKLQALNLEETPEPPCGMQHVRHISVHHHIAAKCDAEEELSLIHI